MGWSYQQISLSDLLQLVKAFIDMLLLASGYQSTGRSANWNSTDIQKAFQWALFLQNVSNDLLSSDDYRDCVQELDSALSELTSNPCFPQGIGPLSCVVLGRAKELLLERLINTFPLRESHLKAVITASVETDISDCQTMDKDCVNAYLEKLMKNASVGVNSSLNAERGVQTCSILGTKKQENLAEGDLSLPLIREVGRRQLDVSLLSAAENGLEILLDSFGQSSHHKLDKKHSSCKIADELPVEPTMWSVWRSRSLSYMLDKRTTRLVSGASLIFSAPREQWTQMFERLTISAVDEDLSEVTELLLLGCVAHRWTPVIEHLTSVPYESITVSRICSEVYNLLTGRPGNLYSSEGLTDVKEKNIMEYLEILLKGNLNQLWKLSPVLAAIAIPSRSQLFRSYIIELQSQFGGHSSSATRCCSCMTDGLEHRECELAERIWCLYTFHIHPDTSGRVIHPEKGRCIVPSQTTIMYRMSSSLTELDGEIHFDIQTRNGEKAQDLCFGVKFRCPWLFPK